MYLDPGTGSVIVQTVIAVIFGGVLAVKMFWRRITARFRSPKDDSPVQ